MSEARTDTTEAAPHEGSAQAAPAAGSGKHRGPAATEDSASSAAGRHRRPGQSQES